MGSRRRADEYAFTRKDGYATTFANLVAHRVFDVKLGRSGLSSSCRPLPSEYGGADQGASFKWLTYGPAMKPRRLGSGDEVLAREMFSMMAQVFAEEDASLDKQLVDDDYVRRLLSRADF